MSHCAGEPSQHSVHFYLRHSGTDFLLSFLKYFVQYFVRFLFMPAPDRNVYGFGFGQLLLHPNAILNSIINQTVDSATWYNTVAGVVSPDIGLGKGVVSFAPHEMKVAQNNFEDITKKIFMLPAREPSNAMFQILGLLLESFERLGNSVDVLTGEHSTANQPASTTLALIEQGLKFYKAASGRLFKGLRDEFTLLFDLNSRHMAQTEEQFFRLFETDDRTISGAAYNVESLDVVPVGASEEVTIVEKLIKAEQLEQNATAVVATGLRAAAEERRQGEIAASRILAVSAASGAGAPCRSPCPCW